MRPALLVLVIGLTSGCGAKFEMPTQHPEEQSIPTDKSYKMVATWHDLPFVQDILLTQGVGTQLFLLFNSGGSGTAPRGLVVDVALTRPVDLGHRFNTLFNPAALCMGGDGVGRGDNRIYVLDRGDTCLAKTNPRTNTCDTTAVTNLALYWRVREYGLLGGDTLSTFTDLNLASVDGVAADAGGNVYVAGTAIVFLTDAFNPILKHREFHSRVYKYTRGPRYPGVVPPDKNMPGANWHRDTTYEVAEGTGTGYVSNPLGMQWTHVGLPGLWIADAGNNSAQKVDDQVSSTGFFRIAADGDNNPILTPADVAADLADFSYVCDTGKKQVLRYGPGGVFIQRVDVEPDDQGEELLDPVAVAADDSLVYVADRGRNEIVRYQRRK